MSECKLCVLGLGGQSVFMEVDHFHAPGETLRCLRRETEPGGKGYNQAVAAARLGAKVCYIGAMGGDRDGEACRERLIAEGVAPLIQIESDCPTAYACILTDGTGENRVTVFSGAADRLSPAFVADCESQIASCDGLLLTLETPEAANAAAMAIAQKRNVPVVLNPAPYRPTPLSLLQAVSVLTPNRREALDIAGLPNEATAEEIWRALQALGLKRVVVTLGGEGALVLDEGRAALLPAERVKAVDTTGAGDCFTAALAVGLAEGLPLTDAAKLATAAAGYSVKRKHVLASLPYRKELDEMRRTL